MRIAIDDAGAGFASLRHILVIRPEIIKLDITLIAGIVDDPACRALASGLIRIAEQIGATIVAEGVENAEQRSVLQSLGVRYGQGFHLGMPTSDINMVLDLRAQGWDLPDERS